jgi:hypothetical protein
LIITTTQENIAQAIKTGDYTGLYLNTENNMEKKKYHIILHKYNDKDHFIYEMLAESNAQNSFVPSRSCSCVMPNPQSRILTYELYDDEAENLLNDTRIKKIQQIDPQIKRTLFDINSDRPPIDNINTFRTLSNEQYYGNQYAQIDLTDTSDVDMVIVDNLVSPNHIEFLEDSEPNFPNDSHLEKRPGASNNSRVFQFKLLDNTSNLYTNDNHGTHVAGIAAGKTQGWCRNARIITTSFYDIESNAQAILDWHVAKGGTRPTIMNNSWGFSIAYVPAAYVQSVNYRGTNYVKPSLLSLYPDFQDRPKQERVEIITEWSSFFTSKGVCIRSIYTQSPNRYYAEFDDLFPDGEYSVELSFIPAAYDAVNEVMNEFIESGIIVISAAGNSAFEIVPSGSIDYDNSISFGGSSVWKYNRGATPAVINNSDSSISNNTIAVGSLSNHNYKSKFSCCGSGVTVFAPGAGIISSVFPISPEGSYINTNITDLDVYNGTSMASPQVAGVLGVIAQEKKNSAQNLVSSTINHTVTVNSTSDGNRFYIDGVLAPILPMYEGNTYIFDISSLGTIHSFNLSTVPDGRINGNYNSSYNYTQNVVITSTSLQIIVPVGAPRLYYFCENHARMSDYNLTNAVENYGYFEVYSHPTAGWPSNSNQAQASGIAYIENNSSYNIYDTGLGSSGVIINDGFFDDFSLDSTVNNLAKYSLKGSSNRCISLDATYQTCGNTLDKPLAVYGDIYDVGDSASGDIDDGNAPPLPDISDSDISGITSQQDFEDDDITLEIINRINLKTKNLRE